MFEFYPSWFTLVITAIHFTFRITCLTFCEIAEMVSIYYISKLVRAL